MRFLGQEKEYTCGCACVRMAISHFSEEIPTERELEIVLETNSETGTSIEKVVDYFKSINYDVISENNSNIQRVRDLYKDGYVILMAISVVASEFIKYFPNVDFSKDESNNYFIAVKPHN